MWNSLRTYFSHVVFSVALWIWIYVCLVMIMYMNPRNILLKYGTFLPEHPIFSPFNYLLRFWVSCEFQKYGFHPTLSLGIQRRVLFLSVWHLQKNELPAVQFKVERFFHHIVDLFCQRLFIKVEAQSLWVNLNSTSPLCTVTVKIFWHVTNTDAYNLLLHRRTYILAHLFHPTSCTPTKCAFLATAFSDPGLYSPLIFAFQISCPFSIASVFLKDQFKLEALWNVSLWWEVTRTSPNSQSADHPLSAACNCLFNIFAATHDVWWPYPLSATWGCAV